MTRRKPETTIGPGLAAMPVGAAPRQEAPVPPAVLTGFRRVGDDLYEALADVVAEVPGPCGTPLTVLVAAGGVRLSKAAIAARIPSHYEIKGVSSPPQGGLDARKGV